VAIQDAAEESDGHSNR